MNLQELQREIDLARREARASASYEMQDREWKIGWLKALLYLKEKYFQPVEGSNGGSKR